MADPAPAPSELWPTHWSGWRRFMPSVWLVFLALPLASSSWGRSSAVHVIVVVALVVMFGALYVWVTARRTPGLQHRGVVELAVAPLFVVVPLALAFYDNGGWIYCFAYTLFPLMQLVRTAWRGVIVVAVGVLAIGVGLAAGASHGDVIAAVCIILGTGGSWVGFGRIMEVNAALRQAQEDRAHAAVAEERLRFARDLHDLLGHSLSVIALKSEVAGRLIDADAERARHEVTEIEDVARRALREVREAVSGYRRATIAVEAASARAALAAAGIAWSEDIDPEVTSTVVPAEVEAVLAWAVREGVTNLLRHSRAHTCSLVVSTAGGVASVVVTDDGVGCHGATGGSGLAGLSERAAEVAGVVEVGPGPAGAGFRLRVAVPLGSASGDTCPKLRAERYTSDRDPPGTSSPEDPWSKLHGSARDFDHVSGECHGAGADGAVGRPSSAR